MWFWVVVSLQWLLSQFNSALTIWVFDLIEIFPKSFHKKPAAVNDQTCKRDSDPTTTASTTNGSCACPTNASEAESHSNEIPIDLQEELKTLFDSSKNSSEEIGKFRSTWSLFMTVIFFFLLHGTAKIQFNFVKAKLVSSSNFLVCLTSYWVDRMKEKPNFVELISLFTFIHPGYSVAPQERNYLMYTHALISFPQALFTT